MDDEEKRLFTGFVSLLGRGEIAPANIVEAYNMALAEYRAEQADAAA